MTFHQLLNDVLADTTGVSLGAFQPELTVCATIVALLLLQMIFPRWKSGAFYAMLIGTAVALYLAIPAQLSDPKPIFTGLLVFDTFSIYMRCLLLFFLLLFTGFTQVSGVPDREDTTEFYVLLLGATLGMCLMVSANHMLIVFLGIEMASVPSYVLAGILRNRSRSSEASLKYAVFGAGAAGIMLYGISLLVGMLGSAHLPTMAVRLADMLQAAPADNSMVLILGGLMVMVGLAFKLSAVPFHFWAPDVFEGAPAEVAAFLSIASKAAALALLVRVALGFGFAADPDALAALEPARHYIAGLIALIAAVTCTFGNLAAYGQTNIKRLLAYSTIAHAGYMMMPVAAAVVLVGNDAAGARFAVATLAFYIALYMFMNLGAFAVVAFVRNAIGSEEISRYAGMIHRSPGVTICMAIILFSLVGLPPLAGFVAKFFIFAALVDAGLFALLVVGGLNTVLSLFYYLRVVKVMVMSPELEERPTAEIPLLSIPAVYCLALTLPVIVLGVLFGGLFDWAQAAASALLI